MNEATERLASLTVRLRKYAARHATETVTSDDLYQIAVEEILPLLETSQYNDTYILRRADSRMVNAIRKDRVYSARSIAVDFDGGDEENDSATIADLTAPPEEIITKRDLITLLQEIADSLPADQRVILAYLSDGWNQARIAREMKTNKRAISRRVQRIRAKFQQAGINQAYAMG